MDDTDLLARVSLPAAWVAHWRAAPDRPVVRDPGGAWLTGADLLARTGAVAGRLAAAGLVPGDRVLLSGPASGDLVVAHAAALRMGCVVVPVNAAYTPREVGVIAADARPRAALLADPALRAAVTALDPAVVVAGPDVDLPAGPGSSPAPAPALDAVGPGDPALLPYTSGTTGTPKGALLSHGNLLASAEGLLAAWRWTAADRLALCLPLFHMHGLGVGLHGTLLAGAQAVLLPRFDVDAVLAAAAEGATLFFGVPTMYARLAASPDLSALAGLRLCVSGSAPLAADLHARIRSRTGQAVLERYGMTETVMLTSNPYDGERRPGTVGVPLPGVEVRLAQGTGEIEVRGPNVFAGYWRRPEATAEAFTADGWFRTGDIGAWDDAGYLRIVGRAKELIITGGYNVYPREVEEVLRAHPSVTDVAVTGTPSEEWGEVVTAWVESPHAVDADALDRWAAARLAPYKRPRVIHRVDVLPRNALGKVVRTRLAAGDP